MGKPLFTNNAVSILAANLTISGTSITLNTGDGAKFPTITGTDFFYATLTPQSGAALYEIVKVTARAGDVLTVIRGQDNTSPQSWSAGDNFQLRPTAAALGYLDPIYVQDWAGFVDRYLNQRLGDVISLTDFGAVGDGSTDDTAALTAAQALSGYPDISVPTGLYKTTDASTALTKNFHGPGQIITGTNNRAKYFSAISAAPSSFGNYSSIETAFNGDLSHSIFQIEHRITGTATLGEPTTGYVYTPEAYPFFLFLENESGWNNGTSDNTGRTAAVALRVAMTQTGEGDCVAFNATGTVAGAKAGATHWLANPAASLFNGDLTAAQAGVYLNPYEIIIHDAGFDVAGIGHVINLDRNNNIGALGAVWFGLRTQNQGTKNPDAALSISGGYNNGLDFTVSDFSGNTEQAAISMKAGQRVYFNNAADASGNIPANWVCTVFNGDYIEYNTGLSGLNLVVGGSSILQVNASQVTVLKGGGGGAVLNIDNAGGQLHVNGTQVVQARQTGFTATLTGQDSTTSWAASTATTAQVAGTVAAIYQALTTHGLIGT